MYFYSLCCARGFNILMKEYTYEMFLNHHLEKRVISNLLVKLIFSKAYKRISSNSMSIILFIKILFYKLRN